MDLPGGKIEKPNLTLEKKEANKNVLIEELAKKVNELEEKNSELKNKITDLEKN